jgi:hypothetical protein
MLASVAAGSAGSVFFATTDDGYDRAFALSSLVPALLLLAVAAGERCLPRRATAG